MENFTTGEIVTLVIGGILALAGAVSTIGGAVEKIVKVVRAAKAPELRQDDKISDIEKRLDRVERKLENDKTQIAASRECEHVLTKGMLALLEHGINGNNVEQMKAAKADVNEYLINH